MIEKIGRRFNMPYILIRDDITTLKVDAVVNAANKELLEGGGVCGAIFDKAGRAKLKEACTLLAPIQTGQAVVTPGFGLPAAFIIHTAGPKWNGGLQKEEELLQSCYENALELACDHQLKSVAFPLISAGVYGFPKEKAFLIAKKTIQAFVEKKDITVFLVLFDQNSVQVSQQLKQSIEEFIDEHSVHRLEKKYGRERNKMQVDEAFSFQELPTFESTKRSTLDDFLAITDETFSDKLIRLIDERGLSDPYVYRKANIDRRLFSKIRSKREYQPKKSTALSLAIALELSLEETQELLAAAGYSLSKSTKFDLIIEYFIREQNYDIYTINEVLFTYHQPLLGAS